MKKITAFIFSYQLTPLVLACLVLVCYALPLPFMGFFMDDWYIIWYKHLFGAMQFPAYFSVDRPLMGYYFVVVNFLLGGSETPLIWQIFGLFTRWLCVYALWGFLKTLWPNAHKQNTLVVLLATVFPGFTQQWIAVVYSFFFTCLAGFYFSLTLMIKAIREPKRFWLYMILSFLIGVYSYAAAEFFFGLELIRPVILWILFSRSELKKRICFWKTLKTYLPFLIAYIIFTIWRVFYFQSVNHDIWITQKLLESPLDVILKSVQKVYQAIADAVFNSWINPLNIFNSSTRGNATSIILSATILVFILLIIWLFLLSKHQKISEEPDKYWTQDSFWLALISLIVAILPFLAADLPIGYKYPYDRFLLAYLFGSCIILVSFFDKKFNGTILVVFLVAISTGYQITNGISYKNYWLQQSDFFWQLSWRAPEIKPNTVLISDDLPFSSLFSATSLDAPLNLIYSPDLNNHNIPYIFILTSMQQEVIPVFKPGEKINYSFRSFNFEGDTSSMLVFSKNAEGCLRILTPTDSPVEFEHKTRYTFWQSAIPLSNPNRIITNSKNAVFPPENFFGKEDRNQWCYYFEKADLAKQQQLWQKTIDLYQEAEKAGFYPQVDSEWLPLIEALIQINESQKALEITKDIQFLDSTKTAGFCNLWTNYSSIDQNGSQWTSEALAYLNCPQ
ncbi:MAG: hypothetical protein NTZ74_05390 [Chloroflexi bacterium]|nr:hypothetical protein [Chloroflexota bacterium]